MITNHSGFMLVITGNRNQVLKAVKSQGKTVYEIF
jgi:hypothetical protein